MTDDDAKDTLRPPPLPYVSEDCNGTCRDSRQEDPSSLSLANAILEIHGMVGQLVTEVSSLARAVRLHDDKIDNLISDFRAMRAVWPPASLPPPRGKLDSYSDLEHVPTEGGTEKYFATREQLRELARAEIQQERADFERERDAQPVRWLRGTVRPHLALTGMTVALTVLLARFWTWMQALPKGHP